MYLEHFKLKEFPFNLSPGTRFLYFTPGHREALDHLLFGIRLRKGFVVLTGEVGAGKTTICRRLLHELESDCATALILNPRLNETQFLRAVVRDYGLGDPGNDKLDLCDCLNAFLLQQAEVNRTAVLLVDEAQGLSFQMLENIRLLSNLETESQKLIQIVLVGQPELREKLNDVRLRQLRQRVSVHYHLQAMSLDDTASYLQHRLKVAGGNGYPSFDFEAIRLIHEYAYGIPRQVNLAGDMALLAAYARGNQRVDGDAAAAAITELKGICS